jgi:cyanate permease
MMAALIAAGSSLGPILAGWIFDTTGKYEAFLIGGVVASIVSGLLIIALPRYPGFAQSGSVSN